MFIFCMLYIPFFSFSFPSKQRLQLVSVQAAVPKILDKTKDDFLSINLNIMREAANIFYDLCKEIPCLTCPRKPEGAMAVMVSGMKSFKVFIMLLLLTLFIFAHDQLILN